MCDSCHAHDLCRVVDDVYHTPVTDEDAANGLCNLCAVPGRRLSIQYDTKRGMPSRNEDGRGFACFKLGKFCNTTILLVLFQAVCARQAQLDGCSV